MLLPTFTELIRRVPAARFGGLLTRLDQTGYPQNVMVSVNVYEAKTHLSQLLDRVARGEEIVIARAGRPVARLVPVTRRSERRTPGGWRGKVQIAPDFDELPPELAPAFQGDEEGANQRACA